MDEEENLEVSMEEIQSKNWEETQMDINFQYFIWFLMDWERQRRMAAVQIVCYVVHLLYVLELQNFSYYVDKSLRNSSIESENVRSELMQRLSTNEKCHDIIRMRSLAFARLCELL